MMKIQTGGLSEGVHKYHFVEPGQEVGLDERFPGDVRVGVVLDKAGTQLLLRADVEAAGSFVCDRCTDRVEVPIVTSYQMYYVAEEGGFENVDPAELQIIPAGCGHIEITDDVRQIVLLAVPLKLLCSAGCAGLCPQCGTNLNESTCSCDNEQRDPRWEPLRSLGGGK